MVSSPIEIGPKQKVGLVFSGGATKAGAFHLGVALALHEQGFRFYGGLLPSDGKARPPGPLEFSTYVGSSAGSIISTYLAAGYSLENIFNSFLGRKPREDAGPEHSSPKILPRLTYPKMFKIRPNLREQIGQLQFARKIFGSLIDGNWEAILQLKWLRATGLFSTAGIEEYIRDEVLLSNRFQDYSADLFIVATQLNHSRKVVFGKQHHQPPPHDLTCQYDNDVGISHACAASTALPIIYAPHKIEHGGRTLAYIDGEIRDTLSSHVAIDNGCDLVIASHTHQPYHFQKEVGSLTEHGMAAIGIQAIYLLIEQKINNHIHNKTIQRDAVLDVESYCKTAGLSEEHRRNILEILESRLHFNRNVDTIYIHPEATDSQLFFGDHFSLSPKKMSEIVKSGFKAAISTLKRYKFADRERIPKPTPNATAI